MYDLDILIEEAACLCVQYDSRLAYDGVMEVVHDISVFDRYDIMCQFTATEFHKQIGREIKAGNAMSYLHREMEKMPLDLYDGRMTVAVVFLPCSSVSDMILENCP